ncbi:MAG TPA: sulfurtransferase TusA family protein [Candidatus Bathyarchaeia archaeon]|nr:sulfurtransferase TusA family protein [Candidatus Bathyarchaeia archaeon]
MSNEKEVIAEEHDFIGLPCSEIRLELNPIIKRMKIGQILKFTTDVPDAITSVMKWCRMHQQELFLSELKGNISTIYIKRMK